jgi:uncharacterized protein
MAGGSADLVDCLRLAEDAATLRCVYELGELPRLKDTLADAHGAAQANFAFARASSGRAAVTVAVDAVPRLVCQRCLEGFAFPVQAQSAIEFAAAAEAAGPAAEREFYIAENGLVSLRELAEEELLLALPFAPKCSTPGLCGHAPAVPLLGDGAEEGTEPARPFSALRDLLKQTR